MSWEFLGGGGRLKQVQIRVFFCIDLTEIKNSAIVLVCLFVAETGEE